MAARPGQAPLIAVPATSGTSHRETKLHVDARVIRPGHRRVEPRSRRSGHPLFEETFDHKIDLVGQIYRVGHGHIELLADDGDLVIEPIP